MIKLFETDADELENAQKEINEWLRDHKKRAVQVTPSVCIRQHAPPYIVFAVICEDL